MPPLALLAPVALPLVAGGVTAALGLAGWKPGRAIVGAGAWAALAVLLLLWLPIRSTEELTLGPLGFGANFDLRLDGVGFVFALVILVPSAILLTLQPRSWQEGTVAALGVAAAVLAVEASGVLLTALAGGTAATLAVIQLDIEDIRAPRPPWGALLAAWLALSWAGGILQVVGGTAVYAAVPVSALTVPVFALLAGAALMASGLFPWRGWPAQLWSRPSLRAAGMAVATLYPLGFYLFVRAYEMGDGRYPQPVLEVLLACLGVLVSLGAAIRAQAAATRREYLGELIPGLGGFALMAIAIGTPVGLVAGLVILATVAVLAACLPLLPDRAGPAALLTIAAAAGMPPGLAFGAVVVALTATFEAGDFLGLIGVAGAAVWILLMVAAARAIRLPAGRGRPANETFPRAAMALAGLLLVAGAALPVVVTTFAAPAQVDVMPRFAGLGGGLVSVSTLQTDLPVLSLFTPLLLLGLIAYGVTGVFGTQRAPRREPAVAAGAEPKTATAKSAPARPPVFKIPGLDAPRQWLDEFRRAAVPDQYRSILNPRALEKAAAGGRPVLWLAALIALAFAVNR
ncbi:MAG TPA: hypothetical protein VHW94_07125 [Candidatus Dormibacteraeota bacterium]|nr:hypothetical protein [Candidatus Dormibacteraeota bacterium]